MAFSFYNYRGRLFLAKKMAHMHDSVCSPASSVPLNTAKCCGGLLLPALFTSAYIHTCEWEIKHLYWEPLTLSECLFARTFWDAVAAGLLTLSILITLSCVPSAQCQLLHCPSSCFAGCRWPISLGFTHTGSVCQIIFLSFSWLFLYNTWEKKGKDTDLYNHVCMGNGEDLFFFFFSVQIYKDGMILWSCSTFM